MARVLIISVEIIVVALFMACYSAYTGDGWTWKAFAAGAAGGAIGIGFVELFKALKRALTE